VSYSPTDPEARPTQFVDVTMPQMGVSVAEGTVIQWRKRPGDWVERDETICEISTDKIDTEIPSPASGRLIRILVEANETVAVGTLLAQIDGSVNPGEPSANEQNDEATDRSGVISPVVQRIAAEHGIDPRQVTGSGVGGRVRKKDLLAYIAAQGNGEQGEPVLHSESPYRPDEVVERREPLSTMRRQIAEHMLRSRRTAAHCTTVIEVDMSRVIERRAELRPAFEARGIPLTYLAFVARATVAQLQEQPILNASLEAEEIVYHPDVNLGIAVALDDGLIVPVIHRAQRLSLEGIAAAIADLSTRARSNQLSNEDVSAGSFTITNPGQFGTVLATPIINQPEVAILDLEAVTKRVVAVEGRDGDSIAIRATTNLCLSFDHRALDGAEAARFLGGLKARLEHRLEQ
jgi:pyruvate/2-oxoglutarate dehydrogenase complex dihydrolipoamide acyltransferase (E2) component